MSTFILVLGDTATVASKICLQNTQHSASCKTKKRGAWYPGGPPVPYFSMDRSAKGKFTVYFKVNDLGAKETGPINNNSIPNITNFIH